MPQLYAKTKAPLRDLGVNRNARSEREYSHCRKSQRPGSGLKQGEEKEKVYF